MQITMRITTTSVSLRVLAAFAAFVIPYAPAQQRNAESQLAITRNAREKELESIAIIDRKVMVPMRDGKRMAADIYRPKDTSKKVSASSLCARRTTSIFGMCRTARRADMTAELDAMKRGYAYVEMNERGHFFSEGNYDILGPPLTDGADAITWMSSQPWSNGKVGTIGCSSTAEWQLGVAAMGTPAYRRDDSAGIRRGRRARSAPTMSRATGIAAARCRCCSSPGSTASRTRCGRCFRRIPRRKI